MTIQTNITYFPVFEITNALFPAENVSPYLPDNDVIATKRSRGTNIAIMIPSPIRAHISFPRDASICDTRRGATGICACASGIQGLRGVMASFGRSAGAIGLG